LLADQFERQRPRLRGVAYRMLGSLNEADDAVQEAWVRLDRSDADRIDNLAGWLTTVVARVCLNMLQSKRARSEQPLGLRLPDPIVADGASSDPEQEALLADSIGLALQVVLDSLTPPERLAFVLHDMSAVPFEDIAPILGRSPLAARQLASRARRRVRGTAAVPDADLDQQREIVDAFLAAARDGDFHALLSVLDPEVILRADTGGDSQQPTFLRGAETVARAALGFASYAPGARPALINGTAGFVVTSNDKPYSVLAFTVVDAKVVEIDILADPVRLNQLSLGEWAGRHGHRDRRPRRIAERVTADLPDSP
jgi:RNA polymerase sigma-70 factor (ECF subfamily)